MTGRKQYTHSETFTISYQMTVPTGFDPEKESLPMIVFLHGAGERGNDLEKVKVHGIPKLFGKDPDWGGLRVITLSPQCPEGIIWDNLVLPLKKLIEEIAEETNADRSRITLTGLSMGGFGTWQMICTYPEMFAAAAPICGGGLSWRTGVLTEMPIRVFHGDADDVVPLCYSQLMTDAVNKAGGNAELTVYPGVGHNSWEPAYEQTDLIQWLAAQQRK